MWRRSGRIEDRARATVDSNAGEAEGQRCGARGVGCGVWCTYLFKLSLQS